MSFDRARTRAVIADCDPQTNANALADLIEAIGELAHELRLDLPDLIASVTSSFADANQLEVTHFECEEDKGDANHMTTVCMVSKWRRN